MLKVKLAQVNLSDVGTWWAIFVRSADQEEVIGASVLTKL